MKQIFHRESTNKLYNSYWKKFSNWCLGRKVHPLAPPLPKLLDFFSYLHLEKNLSISNLLGHRAALLPIFKLSGSDFSDSVELNLLFKAFKRKAPSGGIRPPHWDVNLVLLNLKEAPFEPLTASNITECTIKTIFLTALATAQRVGELQALSNNIGFGRDGSLLLSYSPDFLAKTETLINQVNRSFKIETLSSITNDRQELLLCPVRAIKKYLKLTDSPGRAKKLFVSPRNFSKPLSKNAITLFLKKAIAHAYDNISPHLTKLTRINAHEIRAVATSLRFKYNLSQVALIKHAYWHSNTLFCSRYLQDISHEFPWLVGYGLLLGCSTSVLVYKTHIWH